MDSKARNDKKKIIDICIPAPSLQHLPPTHPDISESNNAVDLIGYWCHTFEAEIHGGPTSFIVFLCIAFGSDLLVYHFCLQSGIQSFAYALILPKPIQIHNKFLLSVLKMKSFKSKQNMIF